MDTWSRWWSEYGERWQGHNYEDETAKSPWERSAWRTTDAVGEEGAEKDASADWSGWQSHDNKWASGAWSERHSTKKDAEGDGGKDEDNENPWKNWTGSTGDEWASADWSEKDAEGDGKDAEGDGGEDEVNENPWRNWTGSTGEAPDDVPEPPPAPPPQVPQDWRLAFSFNRIPLPPKPCSGSTYALATTVLCMHCH